MTLRFVLRNLRKRPFLNFIKVIGLSLALSSMLLIVVFLKHELTFDRFHSRSERIYRFTFTSPTFFSGKHFARVNGPSYIPDMTETFSGIDNYVRLSPARGGVLKWEDEFFKVNQGFECDSTFFDIFDAELLVGNPDHVLDGPGSMVLSESFSRRVFGSSNPVGQILTLPAGQYYAEETDFVVNGIMKDFPQNSHFHPDFITTPLNKSSLESWAWTYLLLHEHADPEPIRSGFKDFIATQFEMDPDEVNMEAHLQPVSDIHLHSKKTREIEANSSMTVIYSFSLAALLLLFIALINYANLNMGMAGYSDKYLFIGKVFGSSKRMQVKHFLFEAIVIAVASLIISGIIAALVIIYIQKQLALNLFTGNLLFMIAVALIFSLLGILAGILPLLRQYINYIRSSLDMKSGGNFKRRGISKGLIVLQYTISIALIVAVFVIHRQTSYALNSGLGVEAPNLICMEGVHQNIQRRFSEFKEELLKYNSIESVSAMLEPPGGEANDMFRFTMEGFVADETEESNDMIGVFPCDYSFASIFNLNFLGGSNFSEKYVDNEGSGEYILNESAMRRLNYADPEEIVGKEFGLIFEADGIIIPSGKIIGVVEDFHLSSLKRKIEPLVLFKRKDLWLIQIIIAFQPDMQARALADMKGVWDKMFPEYPYQYEYIDSMYRNVYSTELLQARLLSIFTLIALFICSMGLLGLSLLSTQRRIKEIGIRKVNGAETSHIMNMLNWDYIKWIILSFVLAIPFAYLAMSKWLESFAYKTSLSWWIFALAGLVALIIALITVSIQSWKASNRNPVEALRYE
ncbi:MAG: ABC transporter permease [Bacteroidota bacterium]